jgi:hypothetical protein
MQSPRGYFNTIEDLGFFKNDRTDIRIFQTQHTPAGSCGRMVCWPPPDIRDGHNLHGAPTRVYLLKAMQQSPKTGGTGLISFNDRCRDFGELHEVILQARKLAVADIEKHQRAVPTTELVAA